MAEVQNYSNAGEMTQRFIEFVMMQSQHAALFLGQIPNPETGEATVNLEAASLFIGQLEMIADKTRNNLSSEESRILASVLSNLQAIFQEISTGEIAEPQEETPAISAPPSAPAPPPSAIITPGENDRKRFSKSYGS